uniref:AT20429p n=1 Tax=Drosophila melanogaster TaxID=7227 RepID=Q6NLK1_DROME|nr:AT20429p [Drosophila melanogaster]
MLALLRPALWLGSCLRGYHMHAASTQQRGDTSLVLVDEARRFIQDCLLRVGVSPSKVRCISEFLVVADYRGNYGSGLNRLDYYLSDLQSGHAKVGAEPSIISETVSTAHVNGNSALGVFVGNFCMDLAVKKAEDSGIGFVVAQQSHDIGMASWFTFRAAGKGLAGIVMSNSAPTMMGPNSKSASIGSNCFAFCVKGEEYHFVLDMATSVKDIGAVEWAWANDEYIPHGWAANEGGLSTCFPSLALRTPLLFPAGGHKGYCLSAVIDILCGVLSGAQYATHITMDQNQPSNLGQVFIALDPEFFLPNFMERFDDFCGRIQNSQPADDSEPIRLPGELERMHMNYVEDLRAFAYPNSLLTKYKEVAERLCVKPIELAFDRCQSRKSF